MKIRMKFAKYGRMAYIGHLDVMRYFQKALRRAGVDLKFTQGFSPHPILSFAAPLGVGIESEGEYADLEVGSSGTTAEMIARMNAVMVPGMRVLDWRRLPDQAKNAMASVCAADYCLFFRDPQEAARRLSQSLPEAASDRPEDVFPVLSRMLMDFLQREDIPFEKQTEKTVRQMNLAALIYDWKIAEGPDPSLFLQVSTGSRDNVKPELVCQVFAQEAGLPWDENNLRIERLETYLNTAGEEEERKLLPMGEIGQVLV